MGLSFLTDNELALAEQIVENVYDFFDTAETTVLYEKLFEHYIWEMPYGTAKGRTGDPCQWLFNKLDEELS